jgi:hypothetical protein
MRLSRRLIAKFVLLGLCIGWFIVVARAAYPQAAASATVSGRVVISKPTHHNQGDTSYEVTVSLRKCKCANCPDKEKCNCCPNQRTYRTDSNGGFRFSTHPGTYEISAAGKKIEVDLADGESKEVVIAKDE